MSKANDVYINLYILVFELRLVVIWVELCPTKNRFVGIITPST